MADLIITEALWARAAEGVGLVPRCDFLNLKGQYCPLGFALRNAGVRNEALVGIRTLVGLADRRIALPKSLAWMQDADSPTPRGSDDAAAIAWINDDARISDEQRKAQLIPLFAAHGINLVFK